MRKILFSACYNTYTQQKACEGLIKLLKDGRYQVDMAGHVAREMWSSYNLAFAFNKRGYEKIQTLHPAIPVIYSILADDYEEEFIEGAAQYEHLLLIAPDKTRFCGNCVTALPLPCNEKIDAFLKYPYSKPSILVGAGNGRSALRAFIVLNTLTQYKINIIYSGEQELYEVGYAPHVTVREEFELDTMIQNASLVIGSKYVALQGALHKKPVIVVGDYGSGGLLTSANVIEQYCNHFVGKIGGELDEYFSLDQFQKEVESAFKLSSRELETISDKLKKEMSENNKKIWDIVSSYFMIQNI
ncbi:hypothetical protein [Bacteroides sp.]